VRAVTDTTKEPTEFLAIDQTLKLVQYEYKSKGASALSDLKTGSLLPPDMLFVVSIETQKVDNQV
jgi:hypothetical protein